MCWKALLVVFALGSVVWAQPAPEPRDGKIILPLTLSPADWPKPVSKSYLLPEYSELQPGSKIQAFLKCFMEQQVFFGSEQEEKRQKFLEMPLDQLPKDVREQCSIHDGLAYDPPYSRLMVYMDQAARYNRTEWNEWFDLRKDGIYFLLPEVQKLRSIASVLKLRMRGEIKNQEFQRAIVTARSLMGLAKALEEHPTLIGNLVGIAISTMALDGLEEMIAQPNCPNLFWAFSDLPQPLISFRYGLSGERLFITSKLKPFLDARRPLSEAELEEAFKWIDQLNEISSRNQTTVQKVLSQPKIRYALFAADDQRVATARKRLIESGIPAKAVASFTPVQVVFQDDHLQYEIMRDELFKWFHLPFHQATVDLKQAEEEMLKSRREQVIGPLLVATNYRLREAVARTDQRVAYLQNLEAIRLHAFQNGGKLPAQLSDIKLPLALDPLSGKPFQYSVKDNVAQLTGENPSKGQPRTNRVYEIRLRK